MKIVCVCDAGVTPKLMACMKEIPDCQVELVTDESIMDPKAITKAMRISETQGPEAYCTTPEVLEAVRDADAIVVHVAPVNQAMLDAAPNVKYVGVLRTGYDNINVELCRERGIQVYNSEGRNSEAVADLTVGLMICEMRNIARAHAALMSGKWVKLFPNVLYSHDMRRCTVGIIGVGKIGSMVAQRLHGFGCTVLGCDLFLPDEAVRARGCEPVSMEELLKRSDFITLHLRLDESTHHMISSAQLDMMKKTAVLVNCGRSGLVDTDALIDALQNHRIGGAAIDVFDEEPLPEDHPYFHLDNVTLTPHIAGTTIDAFANSAEIMRDVFTALFGRGEQRNRIV